MIYDVAYFSYTLTQYFALLKKLLLFVSKNNELLLCSVLIILLMKNHVELVESPDKSLL